MPARRAGRVRGAVKQAKARPLSAARPPLVITPGLLRRMPLPQPDAGGDKEARGRVLVVGGAPEMPGAVVLAANAALRAGAGKLQIATCRSIAPFVALAVPEALVLALPETKRGGIALGAAARLLEYANKADAVLIGPGMVDNVAIMRLLQRVLPRIEQPTLVLDANVLACLPELVESLRKLRGRVVLTPHAGEMLKLTGSTEALLKREPVQVLQRAVAELNAVIALKGRETLITAPGSKLYCNRAGNVGLATSGSGDTLAGVIAGLAARGAPPLQAAVWGVYLHARAGDRLARRMGPLGYLPRELLAEIPPLMAGLGRRGQR